MARLEDKIAEIKDPALRQAIEEEVKTLKEHKTFGLVFEHHQPEVVPLFNAKVKTRETVAKRGGKLSETYRVGTCARRHGRTGETRWRQPQSHRRRYFQSITQL